MVAPNDDYILIDDDASASAEILCTDIRTVTSESGRQHNTNNKRRYKVFVVKTRNACQPFYLVPAKKTKLMLLIHKCDC